MKKEILLKANKILQERDNIETCIKANICPDCGELLETKIESDTVYEFQCSIDNNHFKRTYTL